MSSEPPRSEPPRAIDGLRQVSDARTLRALAHPVRVALVELLSVEGPLTATEAGERIGETPTTCSFHLRQLAKYGFVEEAGGGKGRARPWRVPDQGLNIRSEPGDTEAAVAKDTLTRMWRTNQLRRLERWHETRGSYPRDWSSAGTAGDFVNWLTPAELRALNDALAEKLMNLFPERRTDPSTRPADALPVETLLFNYPISPPPPGGAA